MPTLISCALFQHDRGWENESSLGRIGRYNIYINVGSKVITSTKYIYKTYLLVSIKLVAQLLLELLIKE